MNLSFVDFFSIFRMTDGILPELMFSLSQDGSLDIIIITIVNAQYNGTQAMAMNETTIWVNYDNH